MQNEIVRHKGIISEVNETVIKVNIIAQSACASCHAKGYCGVADMKEKVIEVRNVGHNEQKAGDFVNVTMKKKQGLKAVFYGYFLPFIILLATLIITSGYMNEGLAGLIALSVLIPYYILLYFFRDRIKNDFEFEIEQLK
jgi:sigma-E factor negative regulatory protein RseC